MPVSDTKTKILTAARTEFAAKGVAGARMDQIAAVAGVNKAMLYYYFSSKNNLFKEVLRHILETIMAMQKKFVQTQGSLPDKISIIVSEISDLYYEQPEIARILMHEILNGCHTMADIAQEMSPGLGITHLTGIAPLINQALDQKKIRGDNALHVSLNIMSLSIFHILFLPLIKVIWNMPDLDERAFYDERKKSIIDLLQHGLFYVDSELGKKS